MTHRAVLAEEIESLKALALDGLRALWRERCGAPPRLRSPDLLRLCLAWRLQADSHAQP